MPVTNFGVFDAEAGTISINTSVAAWTKLERMRHNPRVALAFHTRAHSATDRQEYLLVQGRAIISDPSEPHAWVDVFGDAWERFSGQPHELGPFWGWWLKPYHWRVTVEVSAERAIEWPDLGCTGTPAVRGRPLPDEPPAPQRDPRGGTGPRIRHRRAAAKAQRLPDVLLGWVGADGFPVVVPVGIEGTVDEGILLRAPAGVEIPPGGRRAGLTAHWFSRHVVGQDQRVHTGWLLADGDRLLYAPHTQRAYRVPARRWAFNLGAGLLLRRQLRGAREAGIIPSGK
jgi:hypothetical protein